MTRCSFVTGPFTSPGSSRRPAALCLRRSLSMRPSIVVQAVYAVHLHATPCPPLKPSSAPATTTSIIPNNSSGMARSSCDATSSCRQLRHHVQRLHALPGRAAPSSPGASVGGTVVQQRTASCDTRLISVACLPGSAADAGGSTGPMFSVRRQRRSRSGRAAKGDSAVPAPGSGAVSGGGASGPAPSAASSPVAPPSPGGSSGGGAGGGVAAAATASGAASVAVAVATRSVDSGSESDYETVSSASHGEGLSAVGGSHIVPFARRQPRALVLDCAYRPINVLTWYKAFHFEYFGKGEVLEYYPPPAVCTTGLGEFPLPAVLRVPQYTADMQDLCSRVACTRRNVMVRDGFCCQYCGSRRDLTIDHVHPASKGGKETWDNLVTACMRCNQKKSDRMLRDLGWKLRRQPKEPSPFEIGIVAGIATSDILRPPPEWEAYIAPYRERLERYRRAAVEAGLVNLIDEN